MTDKDTNISEIKTINEYEEFEIQFFNEISKLTLEQWLDICLCFEDDEENIDDSILKITRIEGKHDKILFEDLEKKKRWVKSVGLMYRKRIEYFLKLPETIDYNGQPYLLRITANHVTNYAVHSFILMFKKLQIKNKHSLLATCLRPFHGYITLPPLDYNKRPSKQKKKPDYQNIKFSDVASESDFIFHISFPKKYFTFDEELFKGQKNSSPSF